MLLGVVQFDYVRFRFVQVSMIFLFLYCRLIANIGQRKITEFEDF